MARTTIDRRDNGRYRARYQAPDRRWRSRRSTGGRHPTVAEQRTRQTRPEESGSTPEPDKRYSGRWRSSGWPAG